VDDDKKFCYSFVQTTEQGVHMKARWIAAHFIFTAALILAISKILKLALS
jgi:hypothetical protein